MQGPVQSREPARLPSTKSHVSMGQGWKPRGEDRVSTKRISPGLRHGLSAA